MGYRLENQTASPDADVPIAVPILDNRHVPNFRGSMGVAADRICGGQYYSKCLHLPDSGSRYELLIRSRPRDIAGGRGLCHQLVSLAKTPAPLTRRKHGNGK